MIGHGQSPRGPRPWDDDPRATEEYGEDVAQDPGHEFRTARPEHRTPAAALADTKIEGDWHGRDLVV
jgi:hypothetical protein